MKKILKTFLIIMFIFMVSTPALAASNGEVTSLTASGTTNEIEVLGTTKNVTAAVIVQLLDKEENILAMESFTVIHNSFSNKISNLSLKNGDSYTVRVADYDGGNWKKTEITVCDGHKYSGEGDSTCNICGAIRKIDSNHDYNSCTDENCNICNDDQNLLDDINNESPIDNITDKNNLEKGQDYNRNEWSNFDAVDKKETKIFENENSNTHNVGAYVLNDNKTDEKINSNESKVNNKEVTTSGKESSDTYIKSESTDDNENSTMRINLNNSNNSNMILYISLLLFVGILGFIIYNKKKK